MIISTTEFLKDSLKYILTIVIVLVIVIYVALVQQIIGPSMQPTLNNGDVVLLNKFQYRLFDVRGIFGKTKRIHFFPYRSISSSAIEYHEASVSIMMSMDSGYQVRINFVNLSPEGKSDIRKVYFKMIEKINV